MVQKTKVSVSLNEADLRKIKEFSEKNGLSVSAGIRVLLLRGIKQQEARKECLL